MQEEWVPLHRLVELLPPMRRCNGEVKRLSLVSLYRQTRVGLKNGIVLESRVVGSVRVSSLAAWDRFNAALSAQWDRERQERQKQKAEAQSVAVPEQPGVK